MDSATTAAAGVTGSRSVVAAAVVPVVVVGWEGGKRSDSQSCDGFALASAASTSRTHPMSHTSPGAQFPVRSHVPLLMVVVVVAVVTVVVVVARVGAGLGAVGGTNCSLFR